MCSQWKMASKVASERATRNATGSRRGWLAKEGERVANGSRVDMPRATKGGMEGAARVAKGSKDGERTRRS